MQKIRVKNSGKESSSMALLDLHQGSPGGHQAVLHKESCTSTFDGFILVFIGFGFKRLIGA